MDDDEQQEMKQLGLHYLLDFINVKLEPTVGGGELYALMRAICVEVGFTIVGGHLEVFTDAAVSPPGFASVLCIDQSHLSAHCYSDRGILACDAFTCGPLDRCRRAGQMLRDGVLRLFPGALVALERVVDRFVLPPVAAPTP